MERNAGYDLESLARYRQTVPFLSAHLLLKQQAHAIDHLVAIERRGCNVEEEAVEDRLGDPLQRNGQHERWQANEDVGCQGGQTSLLHAHYTVEKQRGKNIKFLNMTGDTLPIFFLDFWVCKAARFLCFKLKNIQCEDFFLRPPQHDLERQGLTVGRLCLWQFKKNNNNKKKTIKTQRLASKYFCHQLLKFSLKLCRLPDFIRLLNRLFNNDKEHTCSPS